MVVMTFQYPLPDLTSSSEEEELTSEQLQAAVDDAVDNCTPEDTSASALAHLMGELGFVTGEGGSDSSGSSEGIGNIIIYCWKNRGCLCGRKGCGDVLRWVGKGVEEVLWGVVGGGLGGVGTCVGPK